MLSPRTLPRYTSLGDDQSWTDLYCGGGGSTSGIKHVPGQEVWTALNHNDIAIETHNLNHPEVDHDKVDITRAEPDKYRRTKFAWISPECTTWSGANGEECDYDDRPLQLALDGSDEEPVTSDAKKRSRVQMEDVPRFARVHNYLGIIVENVTDILKWRELPRWKQEMAKQDYNLKVIVLNSAFAGKLGDGAPQLRDRVYFMFWKKNYPEPNWNKWLRPRALCSTCGDVVDAIQEIKPGRPRKMLYNRQYFYRCPKTACRGSKAYPYALPALSAIDFTLPSTRIGDRTVPLKPNTWNRIEAGLRRHLGDMLVPAGGTWRETATSLSVPMPTRTTSETDALVVPLEGRPGLRVRHAASEPMRAQTTRHQDALVIPLRNNGVARPASQYPLPTFAAGGTHHALVMRNYTARGDQGQMSTRVNEPLRTLTASGKQSLLQWDHALYSYDTGRLRTVGMPLPAQTTVEGDALLRAGVTIEDCLFRMLEIDEIRAGMAFTPGFMLLGNRKEKVMMLGNAVTPPAARDLAACLVEAITGRDIELVAA